MKRMPRTNATVTTALMVALLGALTPLAATVAEASSIFSASKDRHPARTITTGHAGAVAPRGNPRVVKPLGGNRRPARTILSKRPP